MQSETHQISKLPISVIITTKNEAVRLPACLASLQDAFSEVIVVDSNSDDGTTDIAKNAGAHVVSFLWNGSYPKKRQWCLNNLDISNDWVFWLDADERLTPEFIQCLYRVFKAGKALACDAFFVKARYLWEGKVLRHGLVNAKIALFHKERFYFPEIGDLAFAGMGEIEGHYQPVRRGNVVAREILTLDESILHDAYGDAQRWHARHQNYAQWEASMIKANAYPTDPVPWRELIKRLTRRSRAKPALVFFYSYILKFGFLDGRAGYAFAKSRYDYAALVSTKLRAMPLAKR